MAISIDELIKKQTEEVEIQWTETEKVTLELRKPQIFEMAADGNIPNPLMEVIGDLFMGDPRELAKVDVVKMAEAMSTVVHRALVTPSWEQMQKAGVVITDMAYTEIYAWVLGGVMGLRRFREAKGNRNGGAVADVQLQGKRTDRD